MNIMDLARANLRGAIMRILVTGGAGFIGSHTTDRLLKLGHRVRIIDSLEKPVHQAGKPDYLPKEAHFIKGDVRDRSAVSRALRSVDAVFHFAAYQDNLPNYSKYFDVNATGTALLYEVIREKHLPVRKVIVASSQAVMGEGAYRCTKDGVIYPQMRPLEQLRRGDWELRCPLCRRRISYLPSDEKVASPQSQYAMSKYAQEMIAMNLGKQLGIPTVAFATQSSRVRGSHSTTPIRGRAGCFVWHSTSERAPRFMRTAARSGITSISKTRWMQTS